MNDLLDWSDKKLDKDKKNEHDNYLYWIIGIILIITIILISMFYYFGPSQSNVIQPSTQSQMSDYGIDYGNDERLEYDDYDDYDY